MKQLVTKTILALGASTITFAAPPPQTPSQQSQTTPDSQMAAKVRQAIMEDAALTTVASNVRVTASKGTVTLRGKVASQEEKDAVVAKATQIAGDQNVKDELTVAKK